MSSERSQTLGWFVIFEIESHSVALAGLELTEIHLPLLGVCHHTWLLDRAIWKEFEGWGLWLMVITM